MTPVTTQTARMAARRRVVRRSGADKAHAFIHELEGRRTCFARLVRADGEHPAQLTLVGPERVVALLDRSEQLDAGLGYACLERAVALPVELRLDLGDGASGGDGHDLDQVRDAR